MFFFDVSTSGFLSLEKEIGRGLRKKYDRHLGGKKIRNSRRNEQQQQRRRGRARRQCIILIRDTKTNTFSDYKKSFFKLFKKKKPSGKPRGGNALTLPPFTSQPSSGGLFISTYDVYINQPHFSLISSKQLFFSLKRGKRTV